MFEVRRLVRIKVRSSTDNSESAPPVSNLEPLSCTCCYYNSCIFFSFRFGSFLSENLTPTKQEIEDGFDGNICRCTGMH